MKSADVRRTFLEYFASNDHSVLPSSSSIPHGDKTLMFTNAGMVQFKDIFTGRQQAPQRRATTCQKCVRAGGKHNDLDNVGYTTRHLTFFEMLGNFSFGDYFKEDAIAFAWELVTERFGLESKHLWATVFREDDEAFDLWRKISGLPRERIVRLGEKDNFWSMGDVGPCGPCSEILVDRGDAFGAADVENGERFFEIWNLVFMQFDQPGDGRREALPRPSIDTGMGLERMAMVLQGVDSVYDTDVLRALIREIEAISGREYDRGPEGVAHRVLADHVRSLVFTLSDGAEISNEGRGYVLRRILRRASRYGRKIHSGEPILHRLVDTLVGEMGDAYPEIVENREYVSRLIESEEEGFGRTLDRGIDLFEKEVERLAASGETTIPGDKVFFLYDSYGFPVDLVERMADERELMIDKARFDALMDEQRDRARKASSFASTADFDGLPETCFLGYEATDAEAELQAAVDRGERWHVVLAQTPFYGESGGQVGDTGVIEAGGVRLAVEDTKREHGRFVHVCRVVEGDPSRLRSGSAVRAAVDTARRRSIERNHSATHLLHAALRRVAGSHVHQKGSLVDPTRLRFDVTHFSAFTPEELAQAQDLVRENVLANTPVEVSEMEKDEAIALGAMAFFGEKYGDRVRVVRIGDFSIELCGGTHVARTGDIGPFALVSEGSVSAGVRRVEALTANGADELFRDQARLLDELSRTLRVAPDRLLERVTKLLDEIKTLRQQGAKVASSASAGSVEKVPIGDILFVSGLYDELDGKGLRDCFDALKSESERLIAALVSRRDGKAQVLVSVSPALTREGWKAGDVFQAGAAHIEARGGGRPELVQAGGTAPSGAEQALAAMRARVERGR